MDELTSISSQVETRCGLGFTDLNKYLEDFFKEILNIILDINLENLNEERHNFPGLDLGDRIKKKAFQITSQARADKIRKTLDKVANSSDDFNEVYILIIGKKQESYTLNTKNLGIEFKEDNIWDITAICQKIVGLKIDALQKLYQYINSEVVRVKIELETPNQDGEYPTSISNYVELTPKPVLTNFNSYYLYQLTWLKENASPEYNLSIDKVKEDFNILVKQLSKLPRITREFYTLMLERREESDAREESYGRCFYHFNEDRLRRICKYNYIDGEIRLLIEYDFIGWQQVNADPDEPYELDARRESSYFRIYMPSKSKDFIISFVNFVLEKNIQFSKPLVHLDFSDF